MVGDVVGRPGRYFFMEQTPELKQARKIDMVVVNGENAAHGKGFCIFPVGKKKVGVVNLSGRTFMSPIDCPFRLGEKIFNFLKKQCDVILVDFHAEATSEKLAFANHFDGRFTAVVGTHTHIQTADEKILPHGTAYITDLGMVGAENSILGMSIEPVINRFITGRPSKFEVAEGAAIFCAVLIDIDDATNKPVNVERIFIRQNSRR